MKKVLFVCLGNICRSPSAEGIFQSLITAHNASKNLSCDSAGIIGYHAGKSADSRMQAHARQRGVALTSVSRQINPDVDFEAFDYIIGMDQDNIRDLQALAKTDAHRQKIHLMTDFCRIHNATHVPDPYYGGAEGFETVLDILEDACASLFETLQHS